MAMEKGAMGLTLFWPVYIKPAGEYFVPAYECFGTLYLQLNLCKTTTQKLTLTNGNLRQV